MSTISHHTKTQLKKLRHKLQCEVSPLHYLGVIEQRLNKKSAHRNYH
jgi:hypothetical protein